MSNVTNWSKVANTQTLWTKASQTASQMWDRLFTRLISGFLINEDSKYLVTENGYKIIIKGDL